MIQQVADGVYIPATIDEFPVREADGEYRTPEVIFGNGAMVIFTKEDGSGWDLKKGETLVLCADGGKSKPEAAE